jgi:DNA-binding MurR/RpiR family transcriptional regulator
MRHEPKPWTAIGMSRASWYRHGKPAARPTKRKTVAEIAREIHVSQRTFYRARRKLRDDRRARLLQYQEVWLQALLKERPDKSDEQINADWHAHIAALSDEALNKITDAQP